MSACCLVATPFCVKALASFFSKKNRKLQGTVSRPFKRVILVMDLVGPMLALGSKLLP